MNTQHTFTTLLAAAIALALAGCGGGGGSDSTDDSNLSGGGAGAGGGGGGGTTGTINAGNAKSYAAYVSTLGDIIDFENMSAGLITGIDVSQTESMRLGKLINWQIDLLPALQYTITPSNVTGLILPPGAIPCPGGGDISIAWNDADSSNTVSTGDSTQITFNSCITGTDTLSGSMSMAFNSVSGDWSLPGTAWSLDITLTAKDLKDTWNSQSSETTNGTLSIERSSPDGVVISTKITGSVQSSGTDAGGDYAYTINNVNLTGRSNTATNAYSGSYNGDVNESDLGAFSIVTSTEFSGVEPNEPNTGVARVTANDGSSLTMTVLDATSISLEVDTDGDGTTDSTVNTTWAELDNV